MPSNHNRHQKHPLALATRARIAVSHAKSSTLARLPWPYRRHVREEQIGPCAALELARLYGDRAFLSVRVYALHGVLIDTGLSCYSREVAAFAKAHNATRAYLTHHHEDHSGNVGTLPAHGIEVYAGHLTARLVRQPLPLPLYEQMYWCPFVPGPVAHLPREVHFGPHIGHVYPAPGHCIDQQIIHVPALGILFSADLFLNEKVRVFRRDEDFAATIRSLAFATTLDFDILLCPHRPRPKGGRQALKSKLDFLLNVEGEVRRQYSRGVPLARIAANVSQLGKEDPAYAITFGDVSKTNLVRSILSGPTPRPEVEAALRAPLAP